jgi:hypothetical protein
MMTRRHYASLWVFGAVMAAVAAVWVRSPGYMDADYYYATARVLISGGRLQVPFLWNYLATSHLGLPQPAHLYWMPLTTFLSALSMAVLGRSFLAAQVPSLFFTASVPPLTAWMAVKLGARSRNALIAGGLSGFSGFYLPFFVTTDAFASFCVVGALALWTIAVGPGHRPRLWLVAGLLAGLGHLARADGLLLLMLAIGVWLVSGTRKPASLLSLVGGYLVVMAAWFLRMWRVAGGPLSPGGLKAAWLSNYNQLFAYPSDGLTPSHWLASGVGPILQAWIAAAKLNLTGLILVNGLVFLTVLMAVGMWRLRHERPVRVVAIYLAGELALMTVVFPFPGSRGGFFHSSTAAMPLLWAVTPMGLQVLVDALHHRRGWDARRSMAVFGIGSVAIAAVATGYLLTSRQILPDRVGRGWGAADSAYRAAAGPVLSDQAGDTVVAVNNPPGFWLASGLSSVVSPDGGPQALARVVEDLGVRWVVLEHNHPPGLDGLYDEPTSIPWLAVAATTTDGYGRPMYTLRVVDEVPLP